MRSTLFVALWLSMIAACATGSSDANVDDIGDDAGGGDDAATLGDGASSHDGAQSLDAGGGGDATAGGDSSSANDASPGTDSGGVAQKPTQGEVLITEVMYNPAGTEPDAEWFEVYNTTSAPRILDGLTLTDGAARTHTISSATIAAHQYAVFARLRAVSVANGIATASIVYEYGTGLTATTGIILANGANGGLTLTDGATTIAASPYGGFTLTATNASLELKTLTYAAESLSASWCVAGAMWVGTTTDKGTPGVAGDCP